MDISNNYRFAFLGTGNMASAIIKAITGNSSSFCVIDTNICIFDKDKSKYEPFTNSNFYIAKDAADAVKFADYIFLVVKPQNFSELLTEIRDTNADLDNKIFISIAAGVTISSICGLIAKDIPVIRTMPNTPLLIGKGITALTKNKLVADSDFDLICSLFSSLGDIIILPEDKMNAIISVTSSSPAYVYLFIKAMCDAAYAQGFDDKNMLELICKLLIGSAEMILQSGKTPDELIKIVASPNGTTECALNVFKEYEFEKIIHEAMYSCTDRAEQLSKEL